METETLSLGQALEALRVDGGLTLNGLSQTSGIPLTTLHRLFRDQVAKPNPAHLATLARVLGVHPCPAHGARDVPERSMWSARIRSKKRRLPALSKLLRAGTSRASVQ